MSSAYKNSKKAGNMGKIIAFFNMSGGVGKSTSTQNIGYHLATSHGCKVLLVDCDPQASLTTFMGFAPTEYKSTITDSFLDPTTPLFIESTPEWCDLAPTNIYLSRCEIELGGKIQRELQLKKILSKVKDSYDLILVDCLPSLGLLAINCMSAADYLIIPIQTEYKSMEATINLLKMTYEITQAVNPQLQILGVIPTMYDKRLVQHQNSLRQIKDMFAKLKANSLFANTEIYDPIPRSTQFGNAASNHIPLAQFQPGHAAIKSLEKIAKSIVTGTAKNQNLPQGALING